MGNLSASSMDSWTLFWCQPPTPTELQSHAQAPVLIRRQRGGGDAHRPHPPLTRQAKTHNYHQGQRQAVAAQLYRLPALVPAPQLPTIGIMAQPGNGTAMGQADVPWQRPDPMRQTQQSAEQLCPGRY